MVFIWPCNKFYSQWTSISAGFPNRSSLAGFFDLYSSSTGAAIVWWLPVPPNVCCLMLRALAWAVARRCYLLIHWEETFESSLPWYWCLQMNNQAQNQYVWTTVQTKVSISLSQMKSAGGIGFVPGYSFVNTSLLMSRIVTFKKKNWQLRGIFFYSRRQFSLELCHGWSLGMSNFHFLLFRKRSKVDIWLE